MKNAKRLSKSLLILLGLSLSSLASCAHPPDVPVCVRLSDDKGWCTYTIKDEEFFVDGETKYKGKTWKEIEGQSLRVPAESWAQLKSYIIAMCKKHNQCNEEIQRWKFRADSIDRKLGTGG